MHKMHVEYVIINILHKTHKIFTNGKTIFGKKFFSTCHKDTYVQICMGNTE